MSPEQGRGRAVYEELQRLRLHFENVEFHDYPFLNDDCKRHLMGFLDSQSLGRLGMLSKKEKQLAAEIPLKISRIEIGQGDRFTRRGQSQKYEEVRVTFNDKDYPSRVVFKQSETEDRAYFKEAVEFFENLLKKCRYGVKDITLQMGPEALKWAERDDSPVKHLPNVREVVLSNMDSDHQKRWLEKMPANLEWLSLDGVVTSDVIDLPRVRNARNIKCNYECRMTDAQLLQMNAVYIEMNEAPILTTSGVNAFLKRWQLGGGVDGFRRLEITKIGVDTWRWRDILDGLDARMNFGLWHSEYYWIPNKARPNEYLDFASTRHVIVSVTVGKK